MECVIIRLLAMHMLVVVGSQVVRKDGGCERLLKDATPADYLAKLQSEALGYENHPKFLSKIAELKGKIPVVWHSGRIGEINSYLTSLITPSVRSILDLGAGPGLLTMQSWRLAVAQAPVETKPLTVVGVELTPGWVREARTYMQTHQMTGASFYQGDVTNVSLGITFELIYMADCIEHVPLYRRAALWRVLAAHTHAGSRVYLHYPNAIRQGLEANSASRARTGKLANSDAKELSRGEQYFEEVLHLRELAKEAQCHGFRLERSEDHSRKSAKEKSKKGYISAVFLRQ
eukprot:CAMPEP_0115852514 /NCGR_PEP_ID=MMETSP0287-20121206/13037_1 /TAXON_ID=412157 /ORGANISM="Chrysochromulina rotalis, Strain UIO044" /LENGTH=288 /DNA_ID=CAMNT_0003306581 /DNA_START=98 /DNA_END=964 /DNA_ORIENTATION=+